MAELQRSVSQLEGITSKNASKEVIEKITHPLIKVRLIVFIFPVPSACVH